MLLGEQRHNGFTPKTVTRQRRGYDLNPGRSAPESSTLTTRLPSHPVKSNARQRKKPLNVDFAGFRQIAITRSAVTVFGSEDGRARLDDGRVGWSSRPAFELVPGGVTVRTWITNKAIVQWRNCNFCPPPAPPPANVRYGP